MPVPPVTLPVFAPAPEPVADEVPLVPALVPALVPDVPPVLDGLAGPAAPQSALAAGALDPDRFVPFPVPELPAPGVLLRIVAGGQSTVAPEAEALGVRAPPLLSGTGEGVVEPSDVPIVGACGVFGATAPPRPCMGEEIPDPSVDGVCA